MKTTLLFLALATLAGAAPAGPVVGPRAPQVCRPVTTRQPEVRMWTWFTAFFR